MSWEEQLFALLDDLEGRAEELFQEDREAEVADRSQREYAGVSLASRLMASVGSHVALEVVGFGRLEARLDRVAEGWCLLGQIDGTAEWVVRLAAVETVADASDRSVPEVAWSVVSRLGFGSALRRIASAGERCVLHLRDGRSLECRPLRVGADFVEVETGEVLARRVLVVHEAISVVHRPG